MSNATELELDLSLPLDRFTLEVDVVTRAQTLAVFGPSGSGKTSLLESLAGLRAAHGIIRVGDVHWLDSGNKIRLPPERRRVGYVPQEGLLFPHRKVRGNLLAGAARARRAGGEGDAPESARLATVCKLLELEPLLDRRVETLSGGERQRVALGRALCSAPRILLLDEPLASLDLSLRRRLLPYLARVREELAVPMLLVSHDPREVQALADEVLVLSRGRVLARGAPHAVLTSPELRSLAGGDGYETVLPAVLESTGAAASSLRLGRAGEGPVLIVPPVEGTKGAPLLVGIGAREAILAAAEPTGLSARNLIAGRIETVGEGTNAERPLVMVDLGGHLPPLAVEVTLAAIEDLALAPAKPVFVIVKATGCVIYGSS